MAEERKNNKAGEPEQSGIPRHIAIILDGNGRWAKKRGLPRTAGHAAGSENFRRIATYCKNIGVEYLTVYAFSTENWQRPEDEVSTIMHLDFKYIKQSEFDVAHLKSFRDRRILFIPILDEDNHIVEVVNLQKYKSHLPIDAVLMAGGKGERLRPLTDGL